MKKTRYITVTLLTLLVSFIFVPVAFAHPLGNFTINQYVGLNISHEMILVDYVVDMAEIPAYQEIAVFDGVYNQLDDLDGFAVEAAESRMLGFDGKSLIHPSQIGPCHAVFAPTADEIGRAERLVAAATGGAERFEGEMFEQMHVKAAERLLRRAGRG